MTSVYRGSHLNIAASSAVDGSVGCFFDREKTWRCQVRVYDGDAAFIYDCFPYDMLSQLSHLPLSRRGWAVQEHLLPWRTVYFTRKQIFWECDEMRGCETFPTGIPRRCIAPFLLKKRPVTRGKWYEIVSLYSSCNLTFDRDKMVAISGLARFVQQELKDEYVAGFWRQGLEIQLCWEAPVAGRRVRPYRAPTWSRASLDGWVRLFRHGSPHSERQAYFCTRVQDIQINYASSDPFREILSAKLRLLCEYLLRGTVQNGYGVEDIMIIASQAIKLRVCFDCIPLERCTTKNAYILPINGSSVYKEVIGLLLEPASQVTGQYQRIGVFIIDNKESCAQFKEAIKMPSQKLGIC